MTLFHDFINYIKGNSLVKPDQAVLLAVSGGIDSMVMADLFSKTDIPFALAHCNFRLRPGHAEKDQQLVKETADALGVKFYTIDFDTLEYSQQQGISIQMAARQLRYDWLQELAEQQGYNLVATGHHLDDSIETLLINLSRGTGLRGLKGIPVKNENIIRPLLFARRQDIEEYATTNNVAYRQDLSNLEDKYFRNSIRHNIVPVMQNLNPALHQTMAEFFEKMKDAEIIFDEAIAREREKCMTLVGSKWHISVDALKSLSQPEVYLYEFLKPFGFSGTTCKQLALHLDSQPGKRFYSSDYGLVKDRDSLLLFPLNEEADPTECIIEEWAENLECGGTQFHFNHFQKENDLNWPADEKTALLDYDKLRFPLTLRTWHKGDRIVPLGMKGSKKISDLLTDLKVAVPDKGKVLVLLSGEEIAWVAGIKVNDRFKITKITKRVFSIRID